MGDGASERVSEAENDGDTDTFRGEGASERDGEMEPVDDEIDTGDGAETDGDRLGTSQSCVSAMGST